MAEEKRQAFTVSPELNEKVKKMPWGVKGHVLRALLTRVLETAEKTGPMIYGAIIGGNFTIKFRKPPVRKDKKDAP